MRVRAVRTSTSTFGRRKPGHVRLERDRQAEPVRVTDVEAGGTGHPAHPVAHGVGVDFQHRAASARR